jgi:hypothetical protein
MLHRIRRFRPTYASVTATLALFVALGGGAYAASSLPARSVGSKQLKKNAVTRAKIKRNAVNGSKVAANAITGSDVKESTLAEVPLATHAGSAAAVDKLTYKAAGGTAPPSGGGPGAATATCDAGQHVVGGGVRVDDPNGAYLDDDYPDTGNTAWTGRVFTFGDHAAPVNFTVFAICTTATAVG